MKAFEGVPEVLREPLVLFGDATTWVGGLVDIAAGLVDGLQHEVESVFAVLSPGNQLPHEVARVECGLREGRPQFDRIQTPFGRGELRDQACERAHLVILVPLVVVLVLVTTVVLVAFLLFRDMIGGSLGTAGRRCCARTWSCRWGVMWREQFGHG